jgi:carboxyl-terminal processing protease
MMVVVAIFVATTLLAGTFAGGFFVGYLVNRPTTGSSSRVTTIEAPRPTPSGTQAGMEEDGTATEEVTPAPTQFDFQILEEVIEIMRDEYYGEIPDGKTLAYGAIRGMLLTLDDPYTSFIEPKIASILNEDASGEFEGIGAMVTMTEDGYLKIESLMPGQPAEKAGVEPGDLILAVGDKSIVGLGLYEAISFVRGPAGSEAELKIAREGEPDPIYITVTRARIEVPMLEYEMLEDDIAYIHLLEFGDGATQQVKEALKELQDENPQGLIFDLRGNPGGWLSEAITMSDLFLDEGLIAIKRDSDGNEERFYSYDGDRGEDIPMVVLVDQYSASASEIVGGALQDRGRAVLIGEQTVGKGSVQRPYDLGDGSQFRVTIARWFTPDEQMIHDNGLTPDIKVEFPSDAAEDEDPQLDRALEYLLEQN